MYENWDFDIKAEVCTTHVASVPCRKGHVGDFWGVGCTFSTDPYIVAIVMAWHKGEISERRTT